MITIEMCDEQIHAIIVKELSQTLEFVTDDLQKDQIGMFSFDRDENAKQLKKLAKALERVLDYYGDNDD